MIKYTSITGWTYRTAIEPLKLERQENFWHMKTAKKFDAVKMMRDIRNKIDKDIEGMTFEQEREYFKKGSEKYKKETKPGR